MRQAIAVSIKITAVFVKFREMLISQKDLQLKFEQLEKVIVQPDNDIQTISLVLKQLI